MKTQTVPITSHVVSAAGLDTHYLAAGPAVAPVVILLHGGGAGADARGNWSATIPRLADRFRVLAPEMPGFGRTAKPDPAHYEYSQAARNAHLAAFIATVAPGQAVHLVGNSMGGATALGVAVEHPELVARLVLMGSAGLVTGMSPALATIVQYDFTVDGMRRLIGALTGPGYVVDEALVAYRHELSIDPDTRRAYQHIMGWIRDQGGLYYADDYIARVCAPTLVVNGKDDQVVPPAHAWRFLELIPQAWGFLVPACGHWAMLEYPDEFAAIVRTFLLRA
jgi:2-hydroxy-6-oxo-6-(2'-aminophenyl)hexa-2,4-dienoate hydrolase